MRFDQTDVILGGVLVGLFARQQDITWERARRIPYFGPWLVLCTLLCISYYLAPINQEYLTDPVRISYQFYRYAIKLVLYYPLSVLLFTDRKQLREL